MITPKRKAIRRASGTADADTIRRIERMLDSLYEQGRYDLLEKMATVTQ